MNKLNNMNEEEKQLYLIDLKEKIEEMNIDEQKEVLSIFIESNIHISENNNGCFINLSLLNEVVVEKIEKYLEYKKKQENEFNVIENKKTHIKENLLPC